MRPWCLWLLLLSFAVPGFGQVSGQGDASPMPSIFLVAKKDLPDPFFNDSVVLVTHRAGSVPMGVIINKSTPVTLARAAPEFENSPSRGLMVFFGGPVRPELLVAVFRDSTRPRDGTGPKGAIEVLDGVYLAIDPETLREILNRETPPKDLRIFAGHASWYSGQLEAEVARGGWHLLAADPAAIFEAKPEELWRRLERRASTKMLRDSGAGR